MIANRPGSASVSKADPGDAEAGVELAAGEPAAGNEPVTALGVGAADPVVPGAPDGGPDPHPATQTAAAQMAAARASPATFGKRLKPAAAPDRHQAG
jgi:hypothetical protein